MHVVYTRKYVVKGYTENVYLYKYLLTLLILLLKNFQLQCQDRK